ncbi:single-stranded DNA-binding protein [bacterium]|nr:single-stranded DNA-binding protein [bacterium]
MTTTKGEIIASLNRIALIGAVADDPVVNYGPTGRTKTTFSLVTIEKVQRPDQNGFDDVPDYHNIVLNDRLADIAGEYLSKGKSIYVEGPLRTRNNGYDRVIAEVFVEKMQMLPGI